ncbi:multidrug transporter, partial [Mesorhizobium japonicum]
PAPKPAAARTEDWRTLFNDPALHQLIERALVNNRDLRVAALNVEAFQAHARAARDDLLGDVEMGLGVAGDLRQVGHAQDLAAFAQGGQLLA